ncbi:putative ripening-related protein 1 [Prunus yedoensis var. nudiflora]|uniref:Putative ripening-related protein 1 n=1 Tax=Prunus yedoensis var. nudiflora TaxID=2094558 RepID=A0A314U8I7_PRUYE|nr:putative ripening-related protein 1 [Prunus yedoensis var. nudiflora]
MKSFFSNGSIVLLVILLSTICLVAEAQQCRPSGKIRGRKAPARQCNKENDSDCCVAGKMYPTYTCSPPLSGSTKAYLTLNSFEKNGDGGGVKQYGGIFSDIFHSPK